MASLHAALRRCAERGVVVVANDAVTVTSTTTANRDTQTARTARLTSSTIGLEIGDTPGTSLGASFDAPPPPSMHERRLVAEAECARGKQQRRYVAASRFVGAPMTP